MASPWTPPLDKGGTDDLIDDAFNYLFTNSAREIKLADVAARAAISRAGADAGRVRIAAHAREKHHGGADDEPEIPHRSQMLSGSRAVNRHR